MTTFYNPAISIGPSVSVVIRNTTWRMSHRSYGSFARDRDSGDSGDMNGDGDTTYIDQVRSYILLAIFVVHDKVRESSELDESVGWKKYVYGENDISN